MLNYSCTQTGKIYTYNNCIDVQRRQTGFDYFYAGSRLVGLLDVARVPRATSYFTHINGILYNNWNAERSTTCLDVHAVHP